MHKCCSLIYKAIFGVKYLWIPGIHNILNYMCIFIHFGFCFIFFLASAPSSFFSQLIVLFPFFSIFSHHILFAYLIIAISHFALHCLFKPFEFLQLNKLNIFKWALRGLLWFQSYLFWQQRICGDNVSIWFWHTRLINSAF